jgi:hypothetical protein
VIQNGAEMKQIEIPLRHTRQPVADGPAIQEVAFRNP